jgi:hypothetical protein
MATLDEYAGSIDGTTKTNSLPALWTSLLCQVQDTAADPREEVRTGAISTLIRIFENHGDDLSAAAWQLLLQTILIPLLQADAESIPQANASTSVDIKGQVATTKLVLEGIAKLVST